MPLCRRRALTYTKSRRCWTYVARGIGPGVSTIPPQRDVTMGNDYDRFPFLFSGPPFRRWRRGRSGRSYESSWQ